LANWRIFPLCHDWPWIAGSHFVTQTGIKIVSNQLRKRMPKVRANGIEIFYEESGAGEPLLLIAGFACDHSNWSKMAPQLASRNRLITFDNRGVGQSSSPEAPYSIHQMAEDAAGLLEAIGLTLVHVAGHSMGGQIAVELALNHPERVKSLMLLASCARVDERGKVVIDSWGDLPRLVDPMTGIRLSLPWIYTSRFYATPGAIENVIKEMLTSSFPPSISGIYQQSRAITSYDAVARLGDIECPTLVVVGNEDILGGLPFSEQLAHGIRGAKLVVLEKAGHGLPTESPEVTAAVMRDFLATLDSTATR
jgi:pimeloyl-ACP methyl ester carboxylesterase